MILEDLGHKASSPGLEHAIYSYLDVTNEDLKPLVWTKTADQILANVARFCHRSLDTGHQVCSEQVPVQSDESIAEALNNVHCGCFGGRGTPSRKYPHDGLDLGLAHPMLECRISVQ